MIGLASVGAHACTAPSGAFCVDYYKGKTLSGPVLATGTTPTVANNWGMGAPTAGVPVDNFSARWRGLFMFTAGDHIFRLLGDDGVRLKVDGVTVLDGWKDQASTEYTVTRPMSAGQHLVEVEYYEATGQARVEAGWEPVRRCTVPTNQFCVAYYAGTQMQGNPKAVVYESKIDHAWGLAAPLPGVPAEGFSLRGEGRFDFPAGTYRFTTTADDGVRILIDGVPLIDAFVPQGPTTYEKFFWLSGQHRVTVEYFDQWGNAQLAAGWSQVLSDSEAPPAPIGSNSRSPVGSNLSDWPDWSTEQPFLDVFKASRTWIPQAPGVWDTGEAARLDVDANGWVRSLPAATSTADRYRSVATVMWTLPNPARQGGEYVVLYEGEGTLTYGQAARKVDAKSTVGRDVIQVDPAHVGAIQLNIVATDPKRTGNYLRNIRVIPPGRVCDDNPLQLCVAENDPACQRTACTSTETAVKAGRLFHPYFLRTQVPYKALRFMAPMSANVLDSSLPQISQWAQRQTLSSARWNGQPGAPAEVVIDLANQLKADPWVNMPHRASDDYIRQFARLTKARLASDRQVYVEYANEIWNTAFSAGSWVEQQAVTQWPGGTDSPYTKRIQWYGKRSAEMCDLWRAEWGSSASRVTCVVAGQPGNSWSVTAALDCPLWTAGRPCQSHGLSAIAMAPYFGGYLGLSSAQAQLRSWTAQPDGGLGKLFTELSSGGVLAGGPVGGALAQTRSWLVPYATVARQRGLKLLAYEGGQHIVGIGDVVNDAALTQLFINANRDPRMKALYTTLLNDWQAAGGGLFVHFQGTGAYSRWGSWGAIEHMRQLSSPKQDALYEFMATHPR